MPKINVYLPDDLAEAVRAARIPVSAVCQRALEDALGHAAAGAESTRTLEAAGEAEMPLPGRTTDRLRNAVKLAYGEARERDVGYVGTEHLLLGLLGERENLALRVLHALDVEPDDLRRELEGLVAHHQTGASVNVAKPAMTPRARRALDLAVEESTRLGHNYIGCEHLLLGLITEDEGLAGRVLRSMGVEKTVARRAVVTLLSGFVHARRAPRAQEAASPDQLSREILDRLAAIERKLAG